MAYIQDGDLTVAVQDGAKQVTLPLRTSLDFYATQIMRHYAQIAAYYTPTIGNRATYTQNLQWSDDLSRAALWSLHNATATFGQADPEGLTNASALLETTGNGSHDAEQGMTVAAGPLCFGVMLKASGRNYVRVRLKNSSDSNFAIAVFHLGTGTLFSGTGTITKLFGGWYWCAVSGTATVGNSTAIIDLTLDGSTFSYPGSGGVGVIAFRATCLTGIPQVAWPAVYSISATRAVTVPPVDADDPLAFQIAESDLDTSQLEYGLARFTRSYARVSVGTTIATSVQLSKPAISGVCPQMIGAYLVVQPDTSLLQYDAYFAQTVISDAGVPYLYPTGGTYTLSFAGDTTTALNYNDSAGTVQTALNALSRISNRGGVTCSGTYNSAAGIAVTFADYGQITIDTAGLTGGVIANNTSKTNSGYTQSVQASINQTPTTIAGDGSSLAISGGTVDYTFMNITEGCANPYTQRCFYIDSQPSNGSQITGGTFTITIAGVTSSSCAYNCSLATVQSALDGMAAGRYTALPWFGGQSDTVLQAPNNNAIVFVIQFNATAATGGTFTLTVGANTTSAIAYNAVAATVQSALNALTSVTNRGGVTVTGSLLAGYAIAFANAALTGGTGSLTPAGSLIAATLTDGTVGRVQALTYSAPSATRDLYMPAHGIAQGDMLFIHLTGNSTYYSNITNFTVPDANTIRLVVYGTYAWANIAGVDKCGKRTKIAYAPGAATLRAQIVTSYYLPGFTFGVAVPGDILLPPTQSDASPFLQAAFAGTGSINYQVGQLVQWQDSAILSVAKTIINASDV